VQPQESILLRRWKKDVCVGAKNRIRPKNLIRF
jgi:hypothetical protein